jgi:hypothetical protein
MPDGKLIHVAKQANDKNAIAVIDVGIQQIKKDIAADIADEGGRWDSKLEGVTNAYNDRPHSATVVAPGEVSENKVAQFKLLQKNAANFVVNRSQTIAKQTQLREAGAFRVSEPNARSFNPQWSDKAFNLKHVKGDQVTNTSNKSFLLKHTQAVPKGSTEPLGRMTDPTLSRKARYQERANDVVEFLAERGSQMSLIEFEKAIRRNEAEGLIKVLRRNSMTIRSFIRIFPELFIVRNAIVRLRTQAADPPPDPPPAQPAPPPPPPPPAPPRPMIGPIDWDRRLQISLQQRRDEEEARKAKARARVAYIRQAYPGDRAAPFQG